MPSALPWISQSRKQADSPYHTFMPPLVGTPCEIAALNLYLDTLSVPQK